MYVYLIYDYITDTHIISSSNEQANGSVSNAIKENFGKRIKLFNPSQKLILYITGFPDSQSTKQFIWRWEKNITYRKGNSFSDYYYSLYKVFKMTKSSSLAVPFDDWATSPKIYFNI